MARSAPRTTVISTANVTMRTLVAVEPTRTARGQSSVSSVLLSTGQPRRKTRSSVLSATTATPRIRAVTTRTARVVHSGSSGFSTRPLEGLPRSASESVASTNGGRLFSPGQSEGGAQGGNPWRWIERFTAPLICSSIMVHRLVIPSNRDFFYYLVNVLFFCYLY